MFEPEKRKYCKQSKRCTVSWMECRLKEPTLNDIKNETYDVIGQFIGKALSECAKKVL